MSQSLQTAPAKKRPGRVPEPLAQRIHRLTDQSGECWLWLGRLNRRGYGHMTVAKRTCLAHRVSYETFVGPIPEGLEIDHLCRITRCVNPSHLEAVTPSVNMRRAMAATGQIAGKRIGGKQLGESCRNGHVIDEDNTYWHRGLRECLTCHSEWNRLYASGGKPRQRTYTNHSKIAREARDRAGEWVLVLTSFSADTATHTAHYIRSGKRLPAYRPAGSFEAERRTADGKFQVYARFAASTEGGAA